MLSESTCHLNVDLNVAPVMVTPGRGGGPLVHHQISNSNKELISGGCFPFTSAKAFKKQTKSIRLKMELISTYAAKYTGNTCKYLRSEYERALTNTESVNNLNEVEGNGLHLALCGVFFVQLG